MTLAINLAIIEMSKIEYLKNNEWWMWVNTSKGWKEIKLDEPSSWVDEALEKRFEEERIMYEHDCVYE